jgi:hypothetical protein
LENFNNLIDKVYGIRKQLKSKSDLLSNPIDLNLPVISPFKGQHDVKLIILGQDPTIKNTSTRIKIKYTLNLDKNNSIKFYIGQICEGMGFDIENVYATNLFKYFYTIPPANTMDVLTNHLKPNLMLLKEELKIYSKVPILTLGEPVLQLLTHPKAKVREYWDYNKITGRSNRNFTFSEGIENKLEKDFYPFPHQPSIRKIFYKNTLSEYINFIKTKN